MNRLKLIGSMSLVLIVAVVVPLSMAMRANPRLPVILKAQADPETGLLTILGENFGTTPDSVSLGGTPLNVVSWTPEEIIAQSPDGGITPGTYLLRVYGGKGSASVDMAVTIDGQEGTNHWVAGRVYGLYTNLLIFPMPTLIGADSSNTLVVASGLRLMAGVKTPIAVLGTVVDDSHISFEVYDVDGQPYDPGIWDMVDIRYVVFIIE
jgi:hypothetical protein